MFGSAALHLVLAAATASGGVLPDRHCVRAPCLPGLPSYDYQDQIFSRTETAVSMPAYEVKLEQRTRFSPGLPPEGQLAPTPTVVRERVRYYQLDTPGLKIRQCSISRFALVLHEDGFWTLSLRADQNPETEGQPLNEVTALGAPLSDPLHQTTQFKRNLFFVRVRCYGAFSLDERQPVAALGKPCLLELNPAPFWVQRGHPYDLQLTRQPCGDVSKVFDLIDRVEVEFYYR